MPPGWSGSVLRIGVSRGLKRSRLRRPSSLDLAALGPWSNRPPRTRPCLTVKGSLRSGGACTLAALGPPQPLTASLSGGCASGMRSGGQERATRPACGAREVPLWPGPASAGSASAVEWAQYRSGRDPGGRVRLRDHGRLTWTLPRGRGGAPREWKPGRAAPLRPASRGGGLPSRAHCEQFSTAPRAGRRSDLAQLKLEVSCARARVRSWASRALDRVGDSPGRIKGS